MHQRKGKKILIYIFLFLLVGSLNNLNLNNLKFKEIDDIHVTGLGDNNNSVISNQIKNLNFNNIFSINKKKIIDQIDLNNLVEKYKIFKVYPSSIYIEIQKTKFLARFNEKGKIFLVGSNGKLIKNNFSNNHLPFIFGNPDIDEFLNFKKIIDKSGIPYNEIINLYFFPSKRWDLELKNNITLKLSKNDPQHSLKLVLEFLHRDEFKDIKMIDARIKNQVILND